jgi:hypothetical protein
MMRAISISPHTGRLYRCCGEAIFWGCSVTDDVSFFSRFTLKFAEITAAGVATAVSGYLIAHVGGLLSAPAVTPVALPVAVQTAPMWSTVTGSLRAQPIAPVSADAGEERLAPLPDIRSSTTPPERPVANAPQAAPPPPHKTVTADTGAAEAKPHEMESIEAKVRAALAKADANRPAPHDVPSHQTDVAVRTPAVEAQPRSIAAPPASIASAPRAEAVPPPAPPVAAQSVPPLTTVDIQSLPVAGVAITPSPAGEDTAQESVQASVQASAQENTDASHHGLFSDLFAPFKKLPHLLRNDPPEPADQAPRPPMPVGQ